MGTSNEHSNERIQVNRLMKSAVRDMIQCFTLEWSVGELHTNFDINLFNRSQNSGSLLDVLWCTLKLILRLFAHLFNASCWASTRSVYLWTSVYRDFDLCTEKYADEIACLCRLCTIWSAPIVIVKWNDEVSLMALQNMASFAMRRKLKKPIRVTCFHIWLITRHCYGNRFWIPSLINYCVFQWCYISSRVDPEKGASANTIYIALRLILLVGHNVH